MAYNAFVISYSPITTMMLTEKTDFEQTFEFDGFVVRDEKEISEDSTGTVVPLVKDGERVAKGDSIALKFNNDDDAAAYKQIENAKAELERYQNLSSSEGMQDINAEKLNSEITGAYAKIMDSVSKGNFEGLESAIDEFNEKSATKQILADGSLNVSAQVSALQSKINGLASGNVTPTSVSAPDSGYYINSIDGYENTIKYDEVQNLNADRVKKSLEANPSKSEKESLGKIVGNYRWYVVGVTDKEHSTSFPGNGRVSVNFPDSGIKNVKMKVESVKTEGDSIVVVLSCDLMNETYANMRTEKVQIITKSGSGYKVPASAVRFDENNQMGIYVERGKILSFIPAKMIYSDKTYAIVDSYDTNGNGIALYDKVVVKGKDVKDGKVIR